MLTRYFLVKLLQRQERVCSLSEFGRLAKRGIGEKDHLHMSLNDLIENDVDTLGRLQASLSENTLS